MAWHRMVRFGTVPMGQRLFTEVSAPYLTLFFVVK